MSKKSNNSNSKKSGPTQQVKVLYQNLGGTWYAFANVNEEIFFAPVQLKQVAPQEKSNKKLIETNFEKDSAA